MAAAHKILELRDRYVEGTSYQHVVVDARTDLTTLVEDCEAAGFELVASNAQTLDDMRRFVAPFLPTGKVRF